MKVRVDRDLCVGIGNCVALAPAAFRIDNENKAWKMITGASFIPDEFIHW